MLRRRYGLSPNFENNQLVSFTVQLDSEGVAHQPIAAEEKTWLATRETAVIQVRLLNLRTISLFTSLHLV